MRREEYEGRILRGRLPLRNLSRVFQFNGRGKPLDHSWDGTQVLPNRWDGDLCMCAAFQKDVLMYLSTSCRMGSHSTTSTGLPSTSILGVMPRPGRVLEAMRPLTRRGAPSAVLTVT